MLVKCWKIYHSFPTIYISFLLKLNLFNIIMNKSVSQRIFEKNPILIIIFIGSLCINILLYCLNLIDQKTIIMLILSSIIVSIITSVYESIVLSISIYTNYNWFYNLIASGLVLIVLFLYLI
jgi:hypothetical protein